MDRRILRDVVENVPRDQASRPSFLSRERREERRAISLAPIDPPPPKTSNRKRLWLIVGAAVVLAIASGALATAMASASIVINPRQEVTDLDTSIKAYKNPEASHLLKFEILELSGTESLALPALGSKYVERKASGKLTVFNEYSKDPVRLVQNTRFKSSDGKIFRTYTAIVVPGYRLSGGQIQAGNVEIQVVADAPGQSYNIAPGDFSLPGLVGGAMASKVYARSTQSMTGGFQGDVKVVAAPELEKARTNLEATLTQKLLSRVSESISSEDIFFQDAYDVDLTFNEFSDSERASDESQLVSMDGKIYAVVLNKEDLAGSLAKRELVGVGENTLDVHNWEDISADLSHYDDLKDIDELTLRLKGQARFIWQFDDTKLKTDLAGVRKNEYSRIFLNYPGIDRAEVKIKPFWKNRFPSDPNRIKVEIDLDLDD